MVSDGTASFGFNEDYDGLPQDVEFFNELTNVDQRILCMVTGNPCSARLAIVSMYGQSVGPEVAAHLPRENHPQLDAAKMRVKLTENALAAKVQGCKGLESGSCPTRASMDKSASRQGFVKGIRYILKKGQR